ncbi:unnamed protein product [Paramecium octaurelia]|uniref:Uncharacterized protein n=1 Tax=Paramecium octaurelia TaxID=43137 RepID=A0A8S1W237_PAROT|nr:unnamed protein product [Paramecium octaurelia]
MDSLIVSFYAFIKEITLIILPITTMLAIITFGMQLYTYFKKNSQKELNAQKDLQGDAVLNIIADEYKPLINNQDDEQKIDQNESKGSKKDGKEIHLQDIDEKISKEIISINEKLKIIDKLRDCKSMNDQIENIKISIQQYEDKYKEDFQTFHNNSYALYQNNEENQKKVRDAIFQIYEQTNKQRLVQDQYKLYVRQVQEKSDLKKNYNLTVQSANQLASYCNAFREVRGDGNCFYTAFGFQFLSILLFHYSFDQFCQFIEKIKKIELPMKIFTEQLDLKIDDKEIEKLMLQDFLFRLIRLKSIEDICARQESFLEQFAAYEQNSNEVDSCLYGLSTIFFRNYSNYVIENSEVKDAIDDKINLLVWEMECNNNELVISELAKGLDIFVQLIFFKDSNFNKREYGNKYKQKIILLIKPGHYNIGLLKGETLSDKLIQKNNAIQNESKTIIQLSKDYQENYQQSIQESSNLKFIVTNLLDQLQKGQLPETEVVKLKKELSENQH